MHRSGAPYVRNITEDIRVQAADYPGSVKGLSESCFQDLTFRNVTFGQGLGDRASAGSA